MLKTLRRDLPSHIFLIFLVIVSVYPFFFMLVTSVKNNAQFYKSFFGITFPLHFGNYAKAWAAVAPYMWNTAFVAIVSVSIIVVAASLAAYAFARLRFRMKGPLYIAILSLMMIPAELTLIPLFLEIKQLGLMNSLWGLILIFSAGGQAFTIFVLRQAFASLPEEIFESARIDGCSEWRAFWRIALPLAKSVIGTMAIWNLLGVWNSFLVPLVVLNNPSKYPITVGLLQFQSQFVSQIDYGPMFAGYTIAALPLIILFVFTMRMFLRGLTSSAIKF
ncbi:carbohydrate ABC transporter permease [Alicyclobacillus sp. SO9]|uniref:carbohydrate ABC transporter permease n=1 Tax=Alicyclobacillus sp. SO9 TaxID=2665646 RepID=UPI0018E90A70|nr:carbohydrate ABC transporter permease [Alicyclobacillus sp. SO9]QQE77947.1 carbohydrate ABC transporter permease [Alicyclobacillus sp. SO9]